MTFPASPNNGVTATVNGISYTYNAARNTWTRTPTTISDLQPNLGTATTNITTLLSNASAQATTLNTINANVGAFQSYANTKIGTNTNSNLVVVTNTASTGTTTGALVVRGGMGVAGNVYANTIYTTTGIVWAGNGAAFSSGAEFTAGTTPPASPIAGQQWYDTTDDILYEFIENYWVDIQSPTAQSSDYTISIISVGNITTSNIYADRFFYSNGTAFSSSNYGNTEVVAYLAANPQGSTYSNANVASYLTSNVSGIVSTTGALNIPIGTTAQRPDSGQLGSLRYNTTLGVAEVYTLSGWTTLTGAVPTITNITPASYGGEVGAVFTIFGTGFQPDATVRFVTANTSEYISNTVSYGNTTTLQATTPRVFTVAEGPLDVRVIQANGSASTTSFDAIQTGASPTWTTASGTIATIYDNATGTHATIAATDPESSVTYSVVSGSLPAGTTLNASTGAITGDPTDVNSQTTSTFTAAATDPAGNQTTRSFSIVVRPYLDGSTSAKAAGSPAQIATVTGATPTNGVYWYKNSGYDSGNPFQAYTDWSVNSNTGYMILTQSQISGAAVTNFTDVGTLSTSVSGTRGHNNTFREPTATILSNWSGDTSSRCIVGQYRTSTGTTLATATNIQWIQIAVTPSVFKNMFDNVPSGGEFVGTISARSAGGTGSFYWSKTNSEYPNHLQMGNASSDNGWNGNNYIEIRQAGGDTNHSYFIAGDGGGSYWAASLAYNGGSGERVGFFGFAPNNVI